MPSQIPSEEESVPTAKPSKLPVWRIKRGADRRFRSGHPWVYSNELMESPKGITPGACVELQDAGGKFLARGFGNPSSLISFRTLSRDPNASDPTSVASVVAKLLSARNLRIASNLYPWSHRICFGEADYLPGLVIDCFRLGKNQGQVFVVQAHSAGANLLILNIEEILKAYLDQESWKNTSIIVRNDLSVRKLEGILEEAPRLVRTGEGHDFLNKTGKAEILVKAALTDDQSITFTVDLMKGQKTGFFLDQYGNIELACLRLGTGFTHSADNQVVRLLDLCCYVGQWSAQFAALFARAGIRLEVVAVDASSSALELARANIERHGATCQTMKLDVLRDLGQLESRSFDIVISDPPALVQGRKDIPAGTHAYLQLATQVFRIVKKGGAVVSCSCSALLTEESFSQVLSKATQRNEVLCQWIGHGSQSPDHPMLVEFPEGRYLKSWIGHVVLPSPAKGLNHAK